MSSHKPNACHIRSKIAMKIGACQHRAHRTEDSAPVSALNILTGNALPLFSEHFHIAGSRRDASQSKDDLTGCGKSLASASLAQHVVTPSTKNLYILFGLAAEPTFSAAC
jgi:hypothetical protein